MFKKKSRADSPDLGRIGWKYYNSIKKKAMEQEFSWSGLGVSLSIAFFIVVASATGLNLIYQSVTHVQTQKSIFKSEIYRLEKNGTKYLNIKNNSAFIQKFLAINTALAKGPAKEASALKSTIFLSATGGDSITCAAQIKNIGHSTWKAGQVFLETGPYLRSFSMFKDSSWFNYFKVLKLKNDVRPGQTANLNFSLLAPTDVTATVQQDFQLVRNNFPVSGSQIRVFVDVTQPAEPMVTTPAPIVAQNSFVYTPTPGSPAANNNEIIGPSAQITPSGGESSEITTDIKFTKEPIIRVGLYNTRGAQRIISNEIFDVYAGNHIFLSGVRAGTVAVVSFDFNTKIYTLTTPSITVSTFDFLRFIPRDDNGIFTLPDSGSSDNRFRGTIEYHYSDATGRFWAINELPIESYLKGLAETTNYAPEEFQKVMVTAARTYAMYHYDQGVENNIPDGSTKHASEHFDVDATYDQVYRGYDSELARPTVAQAVAATRGVVITYNNNVVVTPYFSQSDGHTRSWQDVWYGSPKPWLTSVSVPADSGKDLEGHGVGMSASGALAMIQSNESWQDTLKYFYQGISLEKIY